MSRRTMSHTSSKGSEPAMPSPPAKPLQADPHRESSTPPPGVRTYADVAAAASGIASSGGVAGGSGTGPEDQLLNTPQSSVPAASESPLRMTETAGKDALKSLPGFPLNRVTSYTSDEEEEEEETPAARTEPAWNEADGEGENEGTDGGGTGGADDNDTADTQAGLFISDADRDTASSRPSRAQEPITLASKAFWMKDSTSAQCTRCGQPFSFLKRKHHCRICGRIFCSKCLTTAYWEPGFVDSEAQTTVSNSVRACFSCSDMVRQAEIGSRERPPGSFVADSLDSARNYDDDKTISATAFSMPEHSRPPDSGPRLGVPATRLKSTLTLASRPIFELSRPTSGVLESPETARWAGAYSETARRAPAAGTQSNSHDLYTIPFRRNISNEYFKTVLAGDIMDGTLLRDTSSESEEENVQASASNTPSPDSRSTTPFPRIRSSMLLGSLTHTSPRHSHDRDARQRSRASSALEIAPENGRRSRNSINKSHQRLKSKTLARQLTSALHERNPRRSLVGDMRAVKSGDGNESIRTRSRSNSAVSKVQLSLEVNSGSVAYTQKMVKQLLDRSEEHNTQEWLSVIMPLISQIAASMQPDLRERHEIDITKFFKVKRVPGEVPPEGAVVQGVVFTKNLALKRMPREILHPRIMILKFPLQYQSAEGQLVALGPVIVQEKEYLYGLVKRIASFRPQLLLLGDDTSRLALEMLADANIAVAYNIKHSTLEAISRSTHADIVTSVDHLAMNPKLGECSKFSVKTFPSRDHPSGKKSYIYLEGGAKRNGYTLVLRGGSKNGLRYIKDIAMLVIPIMYNLKLETYLMRDQFALVPDSMISEDEPDMNILRNGGADITDFDRIIDTISKTLLASSPLVKYPPPLLLSYLNGIQRDLVHEIQADEEATDTSSDHPPPAGLDCQVKDSRLEKLSREIRIRQLQSQFDYRHKQWEYFVYMNPDYLHPVSHQSLAVLYSLVLSSTSIPCRGPEERVSELYSEPDCALGLFIENLYATSDHPCPAELCTQPLSEHYSCFVHGNSRISVVLEDFTCPLPGMENQILMWSYCKLCKVNTPVMPMSDFTWRYSLFKYLELSFYGVPIKCRAGLCAHNLFRDHVRYFGLQNKAVRLHYDAIDMYSLEMPSPSVNLRPDVLFNLRIQRYEEIKKQVQDYYISLRQSLTKFNPDFLQTEELIKRCRDELQSLLEKCDEQEAQMLEYLVQFWNQSAPLEINRLNRVFRSFQADIFEWEHILKAFEKNYVPSEKDLKRLTAQHLRRILPEKDSAANENKGSHEKQSKDSSKNANESETESNGDKLDSEKTSLPVVNLSIPSTPGVDKLEQKASEERTNQLHSESLRTEEQPTRQLQNSATDTELVSYQQPKQDGAPGALEVGTSRLRPNLAELKQKSPGAFRSRDSLSRKSPSRLKFPNDEDVSASASSSRFRDRDVFKSERVMHLAKHFDQIAKEFEKERQKEHKIAFARRARAHSLAPSRPRVEIFQNLSEVFNDATFEDSTDNSSEGEEDAEDLDIEERESGDTNSIQRSSDSRLEPINDENASLGASELSPAETNEVQTSVPEKVSLMQLLANFWANRSSSNFLGLEYPLLISDHVFTDSDIIIREDEPSSLIAFTLSCEDYKEKVHVSCVDWYASKDEEAVLEDILMNPTGSHLRYQFLEGTAKFSCKVYYADQFAAFRESCRVRDDYIQSLSRCIKWDSTGGKSGSMFLKTLDDRFIVKQLSKYEIDAFLKFASAYFEYMTQSIFHGLPSVLAKIMGVYQIYIRNVKTGCLVKMDVIVMENLFCNRQLSQIFDLKGSMRNRHVQSTGRSNEVLLDENLVEFICESPLFLGDLSKRLLKASLWNDTLFLAKMNVMDYSLVIGLDDENRVLVVGIIDFIRTFTWDKKLESWVKERGFVGGGVKEPTIVTPRQYKARFREAMDSYIYGSPSCWYQFNLPIDARFV